MSLCGEQCCLLLWRINFSPYWDADFQGVKRCHLFVERRKVSSSTAKPSICRAVDSWREKTKIRQLSVYANSLILIQKVIKKWELIYRQWKRETGRINENYKSVYMDKNLCQTLGQTSWEYAASSTLPCFTNWTRNDVLSTPVSKHFVPWVFPAFVLSLGYSPSRPVERVSFLLFPSGSRPRHSQVYWLSFDSPAEWKVSILVRFQSHSPFTRVHNCTNKVAVQWKSAITTIATIFQRRT